MTPIIDVTPMPKGFFGKLRAFYRALHENMDERYSRIAEEHAANLRDRTEKAVEFYLALAATKSVQQRRYMEMELHKAFLESLREIQLRFAK